MQDCNPESITVWEQVGIVAQSATAILGLLFALYIFRFERKKSNQDHRLTWFKEIIIAPNQALIYKFFNELEASSEKLRGSTQENFKIRIFTEMKDLAVRFRKEFIILVGSVDETLESNLKREVDKVIDHIVEVSSKPELYDLSNERSFNTLVQAKILKGRNSFLVKLFHFKGL